MEPRGHPACDGAKPCSDVAVGANSAESIAALCPASAQIENPIFIWLGPPLTWAPTAVPARLISPHRHLPRGTRESYRFRCRARPTGSRVSRHSALGLIWVRFRVAGGSEGRLGKAPRLGWRNWLELRVARGIGLRLRPESQVASGGPVAADQMSQSSAQGAGYRLAKPPDTAQTILVRGSGRYPSQRAVLPSRHHRPSEPRSAAGRTSLGRTCAGR